MSVTTQYQERVMQDLESDEEIITIAGGRTAPANWVMKLFPEISWLTKDNMPMVLAVTNQRVLVYKQHLNSDIQLAIGIRRADIQECKEVSGPLNGAIQLTLKDSQSFKFVFKKERVPEILSELQK